jgi:hypothetical protein
MADNVSLPGSGCIISADEISINGIVAQAQRFKAAVGLDGTYQGDLRFGQSTSASSLPITLSNNQTILPVSDPNWARAAYYANMLLNPMWVETGSGFIVAAQWNACPLAATQTLNEIGTIEQFETIPVSSTFTFARERACWNINIRRRIL